MLFRTQSFSLYHGHVPKGNPEELAKGLYKGKANITGIKHDLILSFAGLVIIIAAKCMQGCQYEILTQPQEIKGQGKCEFRHRCVMLYPNEKVERCKLRRAEDMMIETPSLDKEICREKQHNWKPTCKATGKIGCRDTHRWQLSQPPLQSQRNSGCILRR